MLTAKTKIINLRKEQTFTKSDFNTKETKTVAIIKLHRTEEENNFHLIQKKKKKKEKTKQNENSTQQLLLPTNATYREE